MKKPVLVVAHKDSGDAITMRDITDKNGETRQVGVVMVQSKSLSGLSGLTRVSTRTAFVTLELDAIEFLGTSLQAGKPFPVAGKIVHLESLEPYVSKAGKVQEAKINPSTKEEITHGGMPVYRNSIFTEDVNATDVLLQSDSAINADANVPANQDDAVE